MIWKKVHFARSELLGLFVKTLTAGVTYSRHKKENFAQKIKIQIYKKPKTFSLFFIAFLKSTSNSVYFGKKSVIA